MKSNISPELAFAIEYLDFSKVTGKDNSTLESHQVGFLQNQNDLTIDVKSRQIGWSWGATLWSLCRAILKPNHTVFFISTSQDEADNKIKMAKQFAAGFDADAIPSIDASNKTSLAFGNGSILSSIASKAPRGASQADIILDEYAFVRADASIYQGLLPIISRGGRIRIGSSPNGARGRFHDIFTNVHTYTGYSRRSIAWWLSEGLCVNPKAASLVPDMAERVMLYGNTRLKNIFNNINRGEFLQEYCCSWDAGEYQWITEVQLALAMQWYLLHTNRNMYYSVDTKQSADPVNDVLDAVDQVANDIYNGRYSNMLYAGYDVGIKVHSSDLIILSNEVDDVSPIRLTAGIYNMQYSDQLQLLQAINNKLNLQALAIDSTGIGSAFAESAESVIPVAEGVWFSNEKKVDLAFNLRKQFERNAAPVPNDERLLSHIRSIRKNVTNAGRTVFDVDSENAHHADAFWALALAHYVSTGSALVEDRYDLGYR